MDGSRIDPGKTSQALDKESGVFDQNGPPEIVNSIELGENDVGEALRLDLRQDSTYPA